jgi:hypothetical protein
MSELKPETSKDAAMLSTAPWTGNEVDSLNAYQKAGFVHPFTCGSGKHPTSSLVAKPDGWHCEHCDYTQNWAHEFMANWAWSKGYDAQKQLHDTTVRMFGLE